MKVLSLLLSSLVALSVSSPAVRDSKARGSCLIGAFNVKTFGKSKMSKPEVVSVLVDTVQRYDVILIQEIRDSSGEAILQLLDEVNKASGDQYSMVISDRLGRSSYKEQYAFFYRSAAGVALLDEYQWDDGPDDYTDDFEREPFCALFHLPGCAVEKIGMIGSHIKPSEAVEELNHMDEVMSFMEHKWNTPNILLMGDLNADCSYVTGSDWPDMDLNQGNYAWLIPNSADTTMSQNTNCAYDRFVVARGSSPLASMDGYVFHFDDEYDLSYDEAYDVSDHYPVELQL